MIVSVANFDVFTLSDYLHVLELESVAKKQQIPFVVVETHPSILNVDQKSSVSDELFGLNITRKTDFFSMLESATNIYTDSVECLNEVTGYSWNIKKIDSHVHQHLRESNQHAMMQSVKQHDYESFTSFLPTALHKTTIRKIYRSLIKNANN